MELDMEKDAKQDTKPKRKKVRNSDKELVLLRSGRVCGFCYGLNQDKTVKAGQIVPIKARRIYATNTTATVAGLS